jgi:hypothetical protein
VDRHGRPTSYALCGRSCRSPVIFTLCITTHSLRDQAMRREVQREAKLPAFSITVGDLELLWQRLVGLFDSPDGIYVTIGINLPSEQLEFRSVEEMKAYSALRGSLTRFSIRLAKGERRVAIRAGGILMSRAEATATAESEVWCAGALECVTTFARAHTVWYNWFLAAPIGWILVVVANAPMIASLLLPKAAQMERPLAYAWFGITATLAFLYIAKGWLLPAAVIRVSEAESLLRRRAPELSLLIALISAILTVVGWFIGK